MKNSGNNMFKFATKELSQDAFLCWLINGINTKDEGLKKLAKEFIKLIVNKTKNDKLKKYINNEDYRVEIKQQYKNIDILLILGEYYIIIEDKIKMREHDDQINKYEYSLIDSGISHNNIFTCYYKIYDEYNINNKSVSSVITRKDMINLFKGFNLDNMYINDYYEYLEEIEKFSLKKDIVSVKIEDEKSDILKKPQDAIYTSFYSELESKDKSQNIVGWNYADNRSGGTWWYASKKFNNVISKNFDYIYVEIDLKEDRNRIVIKLAKKEKILDIPSKKENKKENKIENYLKEKEYLENGKVKFYDIKNHYVIKQNEIIKYTQYVCYKNLHTKVDIFDQVVTEELLKRLKKYGIGLNNNSKGVLKKDNCLPHKYYVRIASIDVNKYTLLEIEEILDTLNDYLKEIKIYC